MRIEYKQFIMQVQTMHNAPVSSNTHTVKKNPNQSY